MEPTTNSKTTTISDCFTENLFNFKIFVFTYNTYYIISSLMVQIALLLLCRGYLVDLNLRYLRVAIKADVAPIKIPRIICIKMIKSILSLKYRLA